MVFTEEQKKAYLANSSKCPFCQSEQIVGEAFEVEDSSCWQPISCSDCGKNWEDVYTLTNITSNEEE